MGKRIDRAAGWALAAAGLYLYFLNAWESIPLACAAAFAGCVLVRRLISGLPEHRRISRGQAEAALLDIASMPDTEAATALESLIRAGFPDEEYRVVPALKHPEAALNSGDILNLWKANRSETRIVIAATCACDPRAALYARELRSPAATVLDRRSLLRLLRRGPQARCGSIPRTPVRLRIRRAFCRLTSRRPRPRDALIALAMLAMYLFGGGALYLVCALAMLFRTGAGWIEGRGRARLFE